MFTWPVSAKTTSGTFARRKDYLNNVGSALAWPVPLGFVAELI
jgi:hypothetical protein